MLAALLPEGRGWLDAVGRLVGALVPSGWAPHPGVRAVAMDYESGRRTAFGAPGAPPADLAEAVMASCAIPGWYAPVTIGGRRYVDGGACSATNVDLAAGLGLDEVFVLAPMVSFAVRQPDPLAGAWPSGAGAAGSPGAACARSPRCTPAGTDVTVVGPGPEDLEAIGANLMAVERRRTVLETSLLTSTRALGDPEPLQHLPAPVREQEQDVDPTGPDPDHDGGSARAHLEEAG